jgi:DNA-binding transcriptional ArsR family regulator
LLGEEEYDSVVNDISLLSKNQRLVLQALSQREFVKEPNSVGMIQELKMAHSSISQALEVLLKNDFIESTAQGYRVVDPLIKYVLNKAA